MSEPLRMLDQALELSRKELELLLAGDIEQAEKLALSRSELINAAFGAGSDGQDRQALLAKLQDLQALQEILTRQVVRQRDETREDILKVKQEGRRVGGYKSGMGLSTESRSRFVSKRG